MKSKFVKKHDENGRKNKKNLETDIFTIWAWTKNTVQGSKGIKTYCQSINFNKRQDNGGKISI